MMMTWLAFFRHAGFAAGIISVAPLAPPVPAPAVALDPAPPALVPAVAVELMPALPPVPLVALAGLPAVALVMLPVLPPVPLASAPAAVLGLAIDELPALSLLIPALTAGMGPGATIPAADHG